jgi:hypothetical protein
LISKHRGVSYFASNHSNSKRERDEYARIQPISRIHLALILLIFIYSILNCKKEIQKENQLKFEKKKRIKSVYSIMSNQTNPAPKNKQAEAEEYLKKHKIAELFDNITAHLVFNQPGFFFYSWPHIIVYESEFIFIKN